MLDIARRFEDAGVAAIIYTDIARDGLLKGLNLDATIALAEAVNTPVIASGGLASIEDVKQMLAPRAEKLAGAIAGRALYDGRLDPAEALELIAARARARAMSAGEQVGTVLTALCDVLGPVNPWLAALWLASTIVLACLLVFGWQRLLRHDALEPIYLG